MNKLKTFFHAFKNSMFNPAYYTDIVKAPFNFSFKYFLMLAFVLSLASSAAISLKVMPVVKEVTVKAPQFLKQLYPKGLVISAQGGEWYINKPEPYAIPFPQSLWDSDLVDKSATTGLPKNIVVFYKKGTLEDMKKQDTLMLVNKNNMLVMQQGGKIEATPLDNLGNGRITQEKYNEVVAQLVPFIKSVAAITVPMIVIFVFIFTFGWQLFYLVFLAFLLWVLSRMIGKALSYSKAYQVGMHAITLPWLISVLLSFFTFAVPIPFWFTVLATVIAGLGISKIGVETTDMQNTNNTPQENTNHMSGIDQPQDPLQKV